MSTNPRYEVAHLPELPAEPCPCGQTRRAFVDAGGAASCHLVEIDGSARTHYHRRLTEVYLILETEGECFLELDSERVPVRPLTSVLIRPGCRHRAVGRMTLVNLPVPPFDPADEFFD